MSAAARAVGGGFASSRITGMIDTHTKIVHPLLPLGGRCIA
jgi:hypothetical protein